MLEPDGRVEGVSGLGEGRVRGRSVLGGPGEAR